MDFIILIFSIADCGNVYTVPNGRVEFGQGDTTFGNTFPVRCDVGYEIKGDPKITCMHHGGWSNGTSCQIIGKEHLLKKT